MFRNSTITETRGFFTSTLAKTALTQAQGGLWDSCKDAPVTEAPEELTGAGFAGFQTARGAQVSVSSDALSRAQKLWAESDQDASVPVKPMPNAAGKFKISSEAIGKAMSFWNETEKEDEQKENNGRKEEPSKRSPPPPLPLPIPRLKRGPAALSDHGDTGISPVPRKDPGAAGRAKPEPGTSSSSTNAITPVSSRSRQLGVRRRPLGSSGFKPPILSKPVFLESGVASGASPDLRPAAASSSASKRPRLSFNAPRQSMGNKENDVDSQEFEDEILDFLENQEI